MIPCEFQVTAQQGGKLILVNCGKPSTHFYKTEAPQLSREPYRLYCRCSEHEPEDLMMPEGTWKQDRISQGEFVILQVMNE